GVQTITSSNFLIKSFSIITQINKICQIAPKNLEQKACLIDFIDNHLLTIDLLDGILNTMFAKSKYRYLLILLSLIIPLVFPAQILAANCSGTNTYNVLGQTLFPLTDLGPTTYTSSIDGVTYTGGLYPDGTNTRSSYWDAVGQNQAANIYPRDSLGNRDDQNGKIVLLSIGMSNATGEFKGTQLPWGEVSQSFWSQATSTPNLNPQLVIVDGADGSETADKIQDINYIYWTSILPKRLNNSSVTASQIQVVWIKEAIAIPTTADTISVLAGYYESIARNIKTLYPNTQIAYFTSRGYAGYATLGFDYNPEPYAYESAFAVRSVIGDQINGLNNLNYDPNLGPVTAPWITWGPYIWSDGLGADGVRGGIAGRSDGLEWACEDWNNSAKRSDGIHPSRNIDDPIDNEGGIHKVGAMLLNFFLTDTTVVPWFTTFVPNPTPTPTPSASPEPSPSPSPSPITSTYQISEGVNDVNQDGLTRLTTNQTIVWAGNGSSFDYSYMGLRFTGINIPQNSLVTSALLEGFSAKTNQSATASAMIYADAIGNSSIFTSLNLPSQRIPTTSQVTFNPSTTWAINTWYNFGELAPVIQEIVNRSDWQTGNSLSLIMKGNSPIATKRFIYSFENSASSAAKLTVTYTQP
ncbi:hypothetical protein A3A59_05715, partial [Candidatus Gottesmanbacteria bacterium RIFCSPLOWO2_01_FULL_42_10]